MTNNQVLPPAPMLTTGQLQQLVVQAQAGQAAALSQLCHSFVPLIKKEAHRGPVYRALGEDAENAAWEFLLQLLLSYQGQDYAHLPGYAKLKLHYHLLHLVQSQGRRWEHEGQEQDLEQLPLGEDEATTIINSLELRELVHQLSPRDKKLLQLLCQKKKQRAIALQLHCSYRTVQRRIHQLRAAFRGLSS